MGELDKILNEFDIRFAEREDDEDRSEFSFGGDGEDAGPEDDGRVVDFRDGDDDHDEEDGMDFDSGDNPDMDFGDEEGEEEEDTFAGEKRVYITDKLRKMLGLEGEGEEGMGDDEGERFTPSLSDLDLDSEEDDEEDDGEFDFDVFNKRGAE